eukprot:443874_1
MASVGLFENEIECNDKNILKCNCAKRIRLILNQYSNIVKDKHKKSKNLIQKDIDLLIHNTLGDGEYSNTKLLNDFLHLKQFHDINNDNTQFEIMYNYLIQNNTINICDMNNCSTIKRHYRNRNITPLYNQRISTNIKTSPAKTTYRRYAMGLVSRIHVFFMHSYNINKLTTTEIKYIQTQLNESKV